MRYLMIVFGLILFVALGILVTATQIQAADFSVGLSYTDLNISGKVASDGDKINLRRTLGLKSSQDVGVSFRVEGGRHALWLDFSQPEFSATERITRAFDFEGETYAVGTRVKTEYKYDLWELAYAYQLVNRPQFTLAPVIKFTVYDASFRVRNPAFDEKESATIPVPTIGFRARANLAEKVSLFGGYQWVSYSDVTYHETRAGVLVRPHPNVGIEAGHKGYHLKYDDDDPYFNLDTAGFYGQVMVMF